MSKTIQRVLSILLCAVMLFGSAPLDGFVGLHFPQLKLPELSSLFASTAEASDSGTCGDGLTWSYSSSTGILTIGGTGAMNDYSASVYNNAYVTAAPWRAYYKSLKSVLIGSGATTVGANAFTGCEKLSNVLGGESVESIGDYAFAWCKSLEEVTIPQSVQSIGKYVFLNSDNLIKLSVSGYNLYYSADEFGTLYDLKKTELIQYPVGSASTSFDIPDGVVTIRVGAFYGCDNLKSISLPLSVMSIGDSAFYSASYSLEDVYYPGTEAQLHAISIGSNNGNLHDAEFHTFDDADLSGYFGYLDNVRWAFIDDVNILVIIGEGEMVDIIDVSDDPWNDIKHLVKKVVINQGITGIGMSAFSFFSAMTTVSIPDSVTSIGGSAFARCVKLTSITLPDSVTNIGGNAFYGCTELMHIKLPGSIKSVGRNAFEDTAYYNKSDNWKNGALYLGNCLLEVKQSFSGKYTIKPGTKNICGGAFYGCTGLTGVTIPDSVTSIGDYAFDSCQALTSVAIPNSVTSIGESSFYSCTSLISITIPDSVTSIGYGAFKDCTGLTSIRIPDSVKSIGSSAFIDTAYYKNSGNWQNNVLYINHHLIEAKSTLYGTYEIKPGTVTIADDAFLYCKSMNAVVFPDSVKCIGLNAFSGCTGLTSVTIGNGVVSIGSEAFCDCAGLKSVTIGSSVASIGAHAFDGCTKLTSLTVAAENTVYHSSYNCIIETSGKTLVVGCQNSVIPTDGSVTSIGDGAFYDRTGLTSIIIPDSVISIGITAFFNCQGLTSISIPDSVERIGYEAFACCYNLTNVTIPSSVTSIDYNAFLLCGLTSVTIPNSVTRIGSSAFYGCSKLTSIRIPDSIKSIGADAFERCTGLTSVTIPSSVTSIGGGAFYGCTGLTSITIPDSVLSIGESAFSNTAYSSNSNNWSNGLLYIGKHLLDAKETLSGSCTVKSGTKTIAAGAFSRCQKLTGISIPYGIKRIDAYTFYSCTKLKSVTLPASVKSIGVYAFEYCSALAGITIPDYVENIAWGAFDGCTGLTEITLGRRLIGIGSSAFNRCSGLKKVYFNGYRSMWEKVDIGLENDDLLNAKFKFQLDPATANTVYGKNINNDPNGKMSEKQFDKPLEDYLAQTASTEYNPDLAEVLSWFAWSAYLLGDQPWDKDEDELFISRTYESFGFAEWKPYRYDESPYDEVFCAYSFARKEIADGKKLVMITVRGTSGALEHFRGEWVGNFLVATPFGIGWHQDFEKSAHQVFDSLKNKGWLDTSGNTVYCLTGHSKGAAVANLTSVLLEQNGVKKENVFDYNFACPDVATDFQFNWNNLGNHDNMFNINNASDMVPYVPALAANHMIATGELNPLTSWGKYGRSKWFSLDWGDRGCTSVYAFISNIKSNITQGYDASGIPGSKVNDVLGSKNAYYNPHDPRVYMAFCAGKASWDSMKDREVAEALSGEDVKEGEITLLLSVCCPVDFTVTDKSGKTIASCKNNKPTYGDTSGRFVSIFVDGDRKALLISDPANAVIHLDATGDGEMLFGVDHLYNAFSQQDDLGVKYKPIALHPGKQMQYTVTNPEELAENELYVMNQDGTPDALILPDGTEQPILSMKVTAPAAATYKKAFTASANLRNLPEGAKVIWTADSAKVKLQGTANGATCKVTASVRGSVRLTATVIDASGAKLAEDSTTVAVNYTWWQWIIIIVLFGWIWYK